MKVVLLLLLSLDLQARILYQTQTPANNVKAAPPCAKFLPKHHINANKKIRKAPVQHLVIRKGKHKYPFPPYRTRKLGIVSSLADSIGDIVVNKYKSTGLDVMPLLGSLGLTKPLDVLGHLGIDMKTDTDRIATALGGLGLIAGLYKRSSEESEMKNKMRKLIEKDFEAKKIMPMIDMQIGALEKGTFGVENVKNVMDNIENAISLQVNKQMDTI